MCQTKTGDIFKEIGGEVGFVGEKVDHPTQPSPEGRAF